MNFIEILNIFPPQIATLIIAMMPIGENRLSVPIALGVHQMSFFSAVFWSSLGSIFASALVLFSLSFFIFFIQRKSSLVDKFLDWFFTRTNRRFIKKYEKFGEVALLLFVALPLPLTGVWTGSIAAFLFGIKTSRALLFISIGVILSASIVALISIGIFNFI